MDEKADKVEYLKRLMIGHADIQMALSAITFLSEIDPNEKFNKIILRRMKCYEIAFVSAYSRAFTKNSGGKYGALSRKKLRVKYSERETQLHEKILKIRNKIYAHSDGDFAVVRMDMFDIEIRPGETMSFPHLQFDEGMHFVDSADRGDIQTMLHAVMHAIFEQATNLGRELTEFMPLSIDVDLVGS